MREWLIAARTQKKLTMKQMGEKLNVSERYYSMIEGRTRQKKMDISIVAKLSDALNIPIEEIIRREQQDR